MIENTLPAVAELAFRIITPMTAMKSSNLTEFPVLKINDNQSMKQLHDLFVRP